jgi:hypothetical protein
MHAVQSLEPAAPAVLAEPSFDLLVHRDAAVRATALRNLVARRDPSLFVLICAGEAVDAAIREREGLPATPLAWRGWRGVIMGPILAMAADERLVWALAYAGKLIAPQRYPTSLLRFLGTRAAASLPDYD